MKQSIVVIVSLALTMTPVHSAAKTTQIDLHDSIARLAPGAVVVVRLNDGSKISGTFVQVSGDAVEIMPRTRVPVPVRQVALNHIRSIDQKDAGMNAGAKFLVIAGVAAGVMALAALITFLNTPS